MSDHQILFSAPMVRALLDGRKTQTRRVLNPQPDAGQFFGRMTYVADMRKVIARNACGMRQDVKIRYAPGDRLYVREAWRIWRVLDAYAPRDLQSGTLNQSRASIWYEATPNEDQKAGPLKHEIGKFRQGMHMPRWASRLTLKVTDVQIQRLQDISEEDAIAEGVEGSEIDGWRCYLPEPKNQDAWQCPRESFRTLWDSLNASRNDGAYAWTANPWVTATTFEVVRGNIDEVKT